MIVRPRVQVWSDRRMVLPYLGKDAPVPEGAPVLLFGEADNLTHQVCSVKLDDGREVLIARKDLAEVDP